jgi:hypothetical protein
MLLRARRRSRCLVELLFRFRSTGLLSSLAAGAVTTFIGCHTKLLRSLGLLHLIDRQIKVLIPVPPPLLPITGWLLTSTRGFQGWWASDGASGSLTRILCQAKPRRSDAVAYESTPPSSYLCCRWKWHCKVGTASEVYQLPFWVMGLEPEKQESRINRQSHLFCISTVAALFVLLRCFPSLLLLSFPQRHSLPMLNSSRRQRT